VIIFSWEHRPFSCAKVCGTKDNRVAVHFTVIDPQVSKRHIICNVSIIVQQCSPHIHKCYHQVVLGNSAKLCAVYTYFYTRRCKTKVTRNTGINANVNRSDRDIQLLHCYTPQGVTRTRKVIQGTLPMSGTRVHIVCVSVDYEFLRGCKPDCKSYAYCNSSLRLCRNLCGKRILIMHEFCQLDIITDI